MRRLFASVMLAVLLVTAAPPAPTETVSQCGTVCVEVDADDEPPLA